MERKNFGQMVLVPIGYSGIRPRQYEDEYSDIVWYSFWVSLLDCPTRVQVSLMYRIIVSSYLSFFPPLRLEIAPLGGHTKSN